MKFFIISLTLNGFCNHYPGFMAVLLHGVSEELFEIETPCYQQILLAVISVILIFT